MRAVGLVREGEDSREEGESQSPGRAGERGHRGGGGGGWRLPTRVVDEMRREFDRKMDQESAEVSTAARMGRRVEEWGGLVEK